MFGIGLVFLGMFHLASSETVQANICGLPTAPAITAPVDGLTTSTQALTVTGTTTANQAVNLLDNSTLVASLTADGSGNFGGSILLSNGANSIVAQVGNACNQTASSNTVGVTYNAPPPPPPPPPPAKPPVPPTRAPKVVVITPTNNTPSVYIPIVTTPTNTLSGKGLKLQITSTTAATAVNQAPKVQTTTSSSVFVSGTTGVSANVAVVVNGKVVADIVSDASGHFSVLVPLSLGKNKIQLIATLGNKTVTRNLTYKRTAAVLGLGTSMLITYIGTSIVILILSALIIMSLVRRRTKQQREREAAERLRQNAPVNL